MNRKKKIMFLLIASPCVIESEELVMTVALTRSNVNNGQKDKNGTIVLKGLINNAF